MQNLLSMFFNLLYHPFAWMYDLIAWVVSGGQWKNWVLSVLPLIKGKSVLELGSGTGTLFSAVTRAGCSGFALDASQQFLRIIQRKYHKDFPSFANRLIRGRAEHLPFAANTFDTVVATFPSDYIFRPETLAACRRVLRPRGRLVILIGAQIGGKGLSQLILRFLYRVTGQSTPERARLNYVLDTIDQFNFSTRIETIQFQKDTLTVILAE